MDAFDPSLTSIAVHYSLFPLQVFRKLTILFKSLGVKAVFDTSCSRDLSLIESCNEFISPYKQRHSDDKESKSFLPMISSARQGWICYAEKTLGRMFFHIFLRLRALNSPLELSSNTIYATNYALGQVRFILGQ
ncbi:hypothetical protein L1887_18058 [Cichorium endivia]|nr:hypothetical protein L1887_18058 [Cichorium endivia]